MKENGRKSEYRSYRKYGRVRSALKRWTAIALGVVLLAGQRDISVYAMEESEAYEVSTEQELFDGEKEQESGVETSDEPKKSEDEKSTDESAEVDVKELKEGDSFNEGVFSYKVIDADNRYVAVSSYIRSQYEHELAIPKTVDYDEREYTVTEISDAGFAAYNTLTGIDIPDSVEKIGEQAFYKCKKLAWVSMKEGLTTLGLRAFEGCVSLKKVDMPDSVTTIGDLVFAWCTSVEEIKLSSNLSGISEGLFYQCQNLKEITFPCGFTGIGTQMFSGCFALTTITLPSSVIEIGPSAFEHCEKMSELRIAVTVTEEGGQKKVSPIKINYVKYNPPFTYCPEKRDLVFMKADGKTPLTGSDLVAAIDAYDKVTDHDEEDGDGMWYGWTLSTVNIYTINASNDEHGRIVPSGSMTIAGGDDQTFTMTPDEGYQIKSVTVDGSAVTWEGAVQALAEGDQIQTGKAGTYTFSDVRDNHTIAVSFEEASGNDTPPGGGDKPGSGSSGGGNDNGGNDNDSNDNSGNENDGGSENGAVLVVENADTSIVTLKAAPVKATPVADSPAAPKSAQGKEPKTGDSTHVEIYATIAMIAGFTYLLLYFMEERRGMTEREKEVFVAAFIRWAKKGGTFRKCCAMVAIFCILAYYHSVGKRTGGQVCPAQN